MSIETFLQESTQAVHAMVEELEPLFQTFDEELILRRVKEINSKIPNPKMQAIGKLMVHNAVAMRHIASAAVLIATAANRSEEDRNLLTEKLRGVVAEWALLPPPDRN